MATFSAVVAVIQRLALFLLPGPKMLWCSVSVGVFFTDNVYLQYLGFGYYFEVFVNHLMWNAAGSAELCGRPIFAGVAGPCLDAQLFTSFFGFVATHLLCYGNSGLPRAKTFIGFVCFVTMALSLVTMGTCGVASVVLGAVVGVASGAWRVLLYRALIGDPRVSHGLLRAARSLWMAACNEERLGDPAEEECEDAHGSAHFAECLA